MILQKRVLLAAVSGLSVWPLTVALEWLVGDWRGSTYIPVGAVFGFLVLAPLVPAGRRWVRSLLSLVLGSIVIYGLVVEFAVRKYGLPGMDYDHAVVISGLLGALLTGALARYVVPLGTSRRYWLAVGAAGLAGGILFSITWESDIDVVAAAGYVAWQVLVCLALSSAPNPVSPLRTAD